MHAEPLFPFDSMPVYKRALEAYQAVSVPVTPLGWQHRWLADQNRRSCGSGVLNIAEAAGEYRKPEKARSIATPFDPSGKPPLRSTCSWQAFRSSRKKPTVSSSFSPAHSRMLTGTLKHLDP